MKSRHDQFVIHKKSIYLYMIQVSCINSTVLLTPEGDREMIICQKFEGIGHEI